MSSAKHVTKRMKTTESRVSRDQQFEALSVKSMKRLILRLRVLITVTTSRSVPNAPNRLTLPFMGNSNT